jgi:hypothetical protein
MTSWHAFLEAWCVVWIVGILAWSMIGARAKRAKQRRPRSVYIDPSKPGEVEAGRLASAAGARVWVLPQRRPVDWEQQGWL